MHCKVKLLITIHEEMACVYDTLSLSDVNLPKFVILTCSMSCQLLQSLPDTLWLMLPM
jgi:hypothetical protein